MGQLLRVSFPLVAVVCVFLPTRAHAVITRLTPLSDVLKEMQYISVCKVEKVLPDRPAFILNVNEHLKGKLPFTRLPVNLTGDAEAKKNDETPKVLKRLGPDLPVVLFANHRDNRVTVFAYTNGTWFQMTGTPEGETVVMAFTHCEPFLRRTFKGTTDELIQVIKDGLSGKKAPPPADPREPPGLGPEYKMSRANPWRPRVGSGPVFAVIPTIGIGGPLAVLAVLFPALFGGVLVLFRRWAAFFTVVSTGATLYWLHRLYAIRLAPSWWSTQQALWMVLTMLSLLGVLWAWRRHVDWLRLDADERNKATRTEHVVLWLLSIACILSVVLLGLDPAAGLSSMAGRVLLAFSVAVWAGTLYKLYRDVVLKRWSDAAPLATEGVMLWSGACVLLLAMGLQPGTGQLDDRVVWVHVFKENGGGLIVSTPEVVDSKLFVSVAHKQGFETFGVVYCLDLETRKTLWSFNDDGNMKQIYSSPRVADGLLYIGEGFHDDPNCKLYCIDVETGKKVWDYQTTSQTESSPCIVEGKVYIGAGNEGILALDAKTGDLVWQYPPSPGGPRWRVAANPVVVDGRVYIGSGVDRNHPEDPGETSLVCLDSTTGKVEWKVATPLPCWGAVTVVDARVFLPLGNGDVFLDVPPPATPAGAVWCVDARSGEVLWKQDFPNGVLGQPAVDTKYVYCGSRDGHAYCLKREDGGLHWKTSLGSPVIAAPCLTSADARKVFFIASAGRVACLDTETGESHWTYRALEQPGILITSTPVLLRKDEDGITKRRLVFGAALNDLSIPVLYCLEDLVLSSAVIADGR